MHIPILPVDIISIANLEVQGSFSRRFRLTTLSIAFMGLVYLPTFAIKKNNQM